MRYAAHAICAGLLLALASLAQPAQAQGGSATPQKLFAIIYRPGPAWLKGEPLAHQKLAEHAAYWKRIVNEGRGFAAGGFSTSEGGMALAIAQDLESARKMLADDPAIKNGVFTATIEHWIPHYRMQTPLPQTN